MQKLAPDHELIAIDTGPTITTYTRMKGGVPYRHETLENSLFCEWLRTTLAWERVDNVAVEMLVSYGTLQGNSVYDSILMVGRVQEICLTAMTPVTLVPASIKASTICHRSRGVKRTDMNNELLRLYGGKGTKKEPGPLYGVSKHAWSSLAVAHVFKVLYPLGDLDEETTIRIAPEVEGEPIERRKSSPEPVAGSLTEGLRDQDKVEQCAECGAPSEIFTACVCPETPFSEIPF